MPLNIQEKLQKLGISAWSLLEKLSSQQVMCTHAHPMHVGLVCRHVRACAQRLRLLAPSHGGISSDHREQQQGGGGDRGHTESGHPTRSPEA